MPNIEEILEQGNLSLALGNPKEALVQYRLALRTDPRNIEANIKAGNVFGRLAKYDQAIRCYNVVLRQEPENLLALINKGLALHFLGSYGEAIENYDAVLKARPQNTTALYNKSSSLARAGEVRKALDILKTTVRMDDAFKEKAMHDLDFEKIKTSNESCCDCVAGDFQRILTGNDCNRQCAPTPIKCSPSYCTDRGDVKIAYQNVLILSYRSCETAENLFGV